MENDEEDLSKYVEQKNVEKTSNYPTTFESLINGIYPKAYDEEQKTCSFN